MIDVTKAVEGQFYPFEEEIILNGYILEGRLAEFTSPCKVKGTYVMSGTSVYINASLEVDALFKCDKCLADVLKTISARFDCAYYLEGSGEEGDYPYFNFVVDLTDGVSEEILLNIPSRVICKEDCQGVCAICGANLNVTECGCVGEEIERPNPFDVLKNFNKQ